MEFKPRIASIVPGNPGTLKNETCQATNHQNLSLQQWQNVVTLRHLRKWQIVTQVSQ